MMQVLQWLATAVTVWAAWEVGNKRRRAFLIFTAGCVLWTTWGLGAGAYGVVLTNVVFSAINIRNWLQWGKS